MGFCKYRIAPPEAGDYFLKIYGKPEEEISEETDTLDHVATFLISVPEVRKCLPNCATS